MSDLTLTTTANAKKRNLTLRFVITGLVTTILVVALITASGYYLLRQQGLQSVLDEVQQKTATMIARQAQIRRSGTASAQQSDFSQRFARYGEIMASWIESRRVGIYDAQGLLRWASAEGFKPALGGTDSNKVAHSPGQQFLYEDQLMEVGEWLKLISGSQRTVSGLMAMKDADGNLVAMASLQLDVDEELRVARSFGVQLFVFVSLGCLVLFSLLYLIFRNGVLTIERQEQKLSEQIARLSSLLAANKSMQQSIRTASARAVELNEQFLRRVGADLHDGPAQMIGYAVLRLNQISRSEAGQELGHEFHAVKEALDESLDEIRGISSGLVLPELASMSLEQCLRKVVALHGAKSNSVVNQYYTNLEGDISLPIKITAYRFVQEGLNNAHRHGQAEKCRISAQVKNGELQLSLKDNGMGFRMSQLKTDGGHLGLLGLKDRVESLGGKFSINSELGTGTALKLTISLLDEE